MARILVVDDDVTLARMLVDALLLEGHEAEAAETGLAALDRLAKPAWDLVVTDVRMPHLDGVGLFREIGRRHPHLTRRVLFMTGERLSTELERALAATGAPCLRKPFELADFRGVIRRLLGG